MRRSFLLLAEVLAAEVGTDAQARAPAARTIDLPELSAPRMRSSRTLQRPRVLAIGIDRR